MHVKGPPVLKMEAKEIRERIGLILNLQSLLILTVRLNAVYDSRYEPALIQSEDVGQEYKAKVHA